MNKWMVSIAIVFCSACADAEWRVLKRIDSMTDEQKKMAIVTNDEGYSFSVYRISEGGEVWGNFSLSDSTLDQVDWEKPPIYRIDKHEPENLNRAKRTQEMGLDLHAYEWEPKWVNFLMWHGRESEGISEGLVQLMNGKRVMFRYYLSTGGYKETAFYLQGAAIAIGEAVGISPPTNHESQTNIRSFKDAYLSESKRCRQDLATFRACFSRVSDCRKTANQNVELFKACVR